MALYDDEWATECDADERRALTEAARLEGELLAVQKLGIMPDDFRNFTSMFDGGKIYGGRMLDRIRTRETIEVEMIDRRYKFIKTSFAKEFRKGHELHRRTIFDIRSTDWRFLFYSLAGTKDTDLHARINANLPMGGWQECFGITCIGDQEAMQREAVLLRMFK